MKMINRSVRFVMAILVYLLIHKQVAAQNTLPVIDKVKIAIDAQQQIVTIKYRLTDKEDDNLSVTLLVSADAGVSYSVKTGNATGDLGPDIKRGQHEIRWSYAGSKLDLGKASIRLVAGDGYKLDEKTCTDQVDTARLRSNLARIAVFRDPVTEEGKINLRAVKNFIDTTLSAQSFHTQRQPFHYGLYDAENIIAVKKGTTNPEDIYVVCASFDAVKGCPAANNNASGVAGLLEIAKVIAEYDFKYTVVLVATDYTGEEFIGSNKYVFRGGVKDYERVAGAIDLDRIGTYSERVNSSPLEETKPILFQANYQSVMADSSRANFLKVVTNTASMPLARVMLRKGQTYFPELKIYLEEFPGYGEFSVGTEDFLQFSDHISFWYHRYKAIWVTDALEGIKRNNTPDDTIDKINFPFMTKVVKLSLATLIELAQLDHSTVFESKLQ